MILFALSGFDICLDYMMHSFLLEYIHMLRHSSNMNINSVDEMPNFVREQCVMPEFCC